MLKWIRRYLCYGVLSAILYLFLTRNRYEFEMTPLLRLKELMLMSTLNFPLVYFFKYTLVKLWNKFWEESWKYKAYVLFGLIIIISRFIDGVKNI